MRHCSSKENHQRTPTPTVFFSRTPSTILILFQILERKMQKVMDKNVQIGLLCDIYGELLTEKQQNILDLYYNQNLSLAEIAEEVRITRQAVKDSIAKGEKRLFRIRRKTRNYEKSTKTRKANTKDII